MGEAWHCVGDNYKHTHKGHFDVHGRDWNSFVKRTLQGGKLAGNVHGRIAGGESHASPNNNNNK